MAATIAHRGPDDEGIWADPQGEIAIGFRRLAILDLTPEGHQPMVSGTGRYQVAFNGEIYNFASLRQELEKLGHRFRGRSDTEVVLAAVEQWGFQATLPRLWGMFAIALWDSRERVLHLARDRVGKKPLYYGWQGKTLLFGSELKALRAHPAFDAPLDRDSLVAFLRFSYVPSPRSIHAGIHKLPAGTYASFSTARATGDGGPTSYWSATEEAVRGEDSPRRADPEALVGELDTLLRDSVRIRSVADVPLGAFLSGGIDSSAVVALMQTQSTRAVKTFTIGYSDREYDESRHAKAVAAHLGTEHTELQVTPDQARAVIPHLPAIYDEPFADASQIPTFLVSELARTQVTVALSGDGGDEVFGGYNRYVAGTAVWRRLRILPAALRTGFARGLLAISPARWNQIGMLVDRITTKRHQGLISGNRVHKLATVLGVGNPREMYLRLVSAWPQPAALVRDAHEPPEVLPRWTASGQLRAPEHQMMLLDLLGYLPDDVLVKVDRATMAVSLEARAPLLDHRVIEFAWRLPVRLKIRSGQGKWILRRVLERYVPRSLFERPKQGFGVPIDAWLRGPLRTWAQDLLSPDRLRREGLFSEPTVQEALRQHLQGSANRQYQLWPILMFQAWHSHQAHTVLPR